MNILFLLRSLDIGGLEMVTAVMANKFLAEGHWVGVFAFEERTGKVKERFDQRIPITIGLGYRMSNENVAQLRGLLKYNKVNMVINQWGLPLIPIKTLNKAKRGLHVKVISVYHNDPLQNGRIQGVETEIIKTENVAKKGLLRLKKFVYRCVTGYAMGYIYRKSDRFEVLSPSFVEHFKQFTKIRHTKRLVVQTNPITIDTDGFEYRQEKKRKEVLYVGRIDYTQKRVHRLVEVWAQIEHKVPNWNLTIVGDGPERENIEHMVKDLELQHVHFEGFQQPRPYYERASILMLTSEFEGFPLVLAEAMSFGVVPVVYGSYSAVYDIIEDGMDGAIIEKTTNGFEASIMAERIGLLMGNPSLLNSMAARAIAKSKNYSMDKIYKQWMKVMVDLS